MNYYQYGDFFLQYRDTQDFAIIHEVLIDECYAFAKHSIQQANTILDLGAHIGAFSLYSATLNPHASIFAVEAFEENCQLLQKNFKRNALSATALQTLASSSSGIQHLQLSKKNQNHSVVLPYFPTQESRKVDAKTLTQIFHESGFQQCDLLKMDIEGAEFEVLQSTPPELFLNIGAIILEYHEHGTYTKRGLVDFLQTQGFHLEYEEESKYKKGIGVMLFYNPNFSK